MEPEVSFFYLAKIRIRNLKPKEMKEFPVPFVPDIHIYLHAVVALSRQYYGAVAAFFVIISGDDILNQRK